MKAAPGESAAARLPPKAAARPEGALRSSPSEVEEGAAESTVGKAAPPRRDSKPAAVDDVAEGFDVGEPCGWGEKSPVPAETSPLPFNAGEVGAESSP